MTEQINLDHRQPDSSTRPLTVWILVCVLLTVAFAIFWVVYNPALLKHVERRCENGPEPNTGMTAASDPFLYKFSLDLYKTIAKHTPVDQNIVISPFSAETALTMAYFGAGGLTKLELAAVLGIGKTSVKSIARKFRTVTGESDGYVLHSANGVYLQDSLPLSENFTSLISDVFGGNISNVDFVNAGEAARKMINAFVAEQTGDVIKDLLSSGTLTPESRLVLVNALYFKSDWESKFNKGDTVQRDFNLANLSKVPYDEMYKCSKFYYAVSPELNGTQVLEMRYKHGEASMILLLPNNQSDVQSLEEILTPTTLELALNQLIRREVIVGIPKFKFQMGMELEETLSAIGLRRAFTDEADFSGMSDAAKARLKMSQILQKVVIEVDEKGTEAAAATVTSMMLLSGPDESLPVFIADRPFLYFVRHNQSKSILFMGRVANPSNSE